MKALFASIWGAILFHSTGVFAAMATHGDGLRHSAGGGDSVHHAPVDHHGSEGLPQFDPSSFPSQIFWLFITFSVLYLFFSRKTLPEISGVIESRQDQIQNDLDTAESLKNEAEKIHANYERRLEQAREKASKAFAEADRLIQEEAATRTAAFYEGATSEIRAMENAIEKAKMAAMDDMNALAAEIASRAAEKIIGIPTDIKQAKSVVESLQVKKAKAA